MDIHSYPPYTVIHAVLPEDLSIVTDWFRAIVLKGMKSFESIGLNWESAKVSIAANPETINGVFAEYAAVGCEDEKLVQNQRYEEFLQRQALPIYGRLYTIISSDKILKGAIYFIIWLDAEEVRPQNPWLLLKGQQVMVTL